MIARAIAALFLGAAASVFAADHRDSPVATNDPAADINDVYAFMNPTDPGEVIFALTFLPDANVTTRFSDAVEYRLHIEQGGGVNRDLLCTFSGNATQVRCTGPGGLRASGAVGGVVNGDGMRLFAGLRDDPFFFDLDAFNRTKATLVASFTNPGVDFFAHLNTQAIVLGIRTDRLLDSSGTSVLKVWSSTRRIAGDGISGGITGAWHDAANTGHGFFIQVVRNADGTERFIVTWDVYSPAQQQLYLVGDSAFSGNSVTLDLYSTFGGRFPPPFPADQIQRLPWGTITFSFTDCNHGTATYNSTRPGYGSGTIPLTRLTNISGLDCRFLTSGQIDRMGRPGINTAVIDLLSSTGLKNAYNRSQNPADWAGQFQSHIEGNISALDTLDGHPGNTLLPPAALAGVLVDDRLIIDVSKAACGPYLAVELGVAGQCGGRTLARDVIDDSLGALVGPGVSDNVGTDSTFLTTFPFVGAPYQ